jgi:hypothetical protein
MNMGLVSQQSHGTGRPAATAIDVGDVRLGGRVAEGALADDLDLVIPSFQDLVRDAGPGPGQDPVQMHAQDPHQLLEKLEAAVAAAPEPLAQVAFGLCRAPIVQEPTQVLSEEIGPSDGAVQLRYCKAGRINTARSWGHYTGSG